MKLKTVPQSENIAPSSANKMDKVSLSSSFSLSRVNFPFTLR